MLSLVYTSTAVDTFDDDTLATLLMNSRSNNRRLGLTGFLLYRDGQFIQVLEGDDEVVRDRLRVISADPRHTDVSVLVEDEEAERLFPSWSMGYEPASDDLADQIPGYRATFDDLADSTPGFGNQPALRQMLQWFQMRAPQAA
ncbi:acylphosphatase [Frondihabitans sp. PhB188]|uniref:BLUF domain-containing protein n=1 Tax=Frondihabitans sp. PhB188 TaxID=2485200 RepID=UPI000F48C442|nr:BLUF domain-containing protein [Frondihabitans sp. PhB188]ROQ38373.1 acylphosphatase [Frondihabitans sp. PhB188]